MTLPAFLLPIELIDNALTAYFTLFFELLQLTTPPETGFVNYCHPAFLDPLRGSLCMMLWCILRAAARKMHHNIIHLRAVGALSRIIHRPCHILLLGGGVIYDTIKKSSPLKTL